MSPSTKKELQALKRFKISLFLFVTRILNQTFMPAMSYSTIPATVHTMQRPKYSSANRLYYSLFLIIENKTQHA